MYFTVKLHTFLSKNVIVPNSGRRQPYISVILPKVQGQLTDFLLYTQSQHNEYTVSY